jgi:hypothetical protein
VRPKGRIVSKKERVMASAASRKQYPLPFTKRTPKESICMRCFATVRAADEESLCEAEERHGKECAEG